MISHSDKSKFYFSFEIGAIIVCVFVSACVRVF